MQINEQKILGKPLKDYPKGFFQINSLEELIQAEENLSKKINEQHIKNGVRIIGQSVRIGPDVLIGAGSVIGPNCTIEGKTIIGKNVLIEYAVVRDSVIDDDCTIGPFANLRPGTVLGKGCKIGDFVETKNAIFGNNSKVNHLSYIGDAEIGNNVNIGAGAITVNYDGKNKHKTAVGDDSFIGCNANLVAPVEIGSNAFVAAGSTITDNVPDLALGIARQRQTNKNNWKK